MMTRQQRQQQQHQWFQQLLARAALTDATRMAWLHQLKDDARRAITRAAVLDRKQEDWRYSRIDSLFDNSFDPLLDYDPVKSRLEISDYLLPSLDSYRLVFINGHFMASLSDLQQLPEV